MVRRPGTARLAKVVVIAALWVVVGAAVNVAVAWICVLCAPSVGEDLSKFEGRFPNPDASDGSAPWRWEVRLYQAPVFGLSTEHRLKDDGLPGVRRRALMETWTFDTSSGWPCPALGAARMLTGTHFPSEKDVTPSDWGVWEKGIPQPALVSRFLASAEVANLPFLLQEPHTLAVRPLWPGFAINTVVYAALAWGIWCVPGIVRRSVRRRRARRGDCAACGYSLAGIVGKCPECGRGVSPAAGVADPID